MRHGQKGRSGFFVAGRKSAGFLEPPEEAFDFVGVGVEVLIVGAFEAVFLGWNHRLGVSGGNGFQYVVGVGVAQE